VVIGGKLQQLPPTRPPVKLAQHALLKIMRRPLEVNLDCQHRSGLIDTRQLPLFICGGVHRP
jgi:hypothetical protein